MGREEYGHGWEREPVGEERGVRNVEKVYEKGGG